MRRRRAFTLTDLMMTIAVIGIVAAVAIPSTAPSARARLRGGAMLLGSDIEYAQTLSLASPMDPAMVVFADDGRSYWIAHESDPATAVEAPGAEEGPYRVELGSGRAALLFDCTMQVTGAPEGRLVFDEFARPLAPGDVRIVITNPADAIAVTVRAGSGTIVYE